MSEINKPENDNADLKCPFNPDQYKKKVNVEVDGVAPVGSLPWALIQVYLGKEVHRSGWNAPIEHMRLTHKSEVGSADDGAAYIEKSDKGGYWSRWQPTQEDLMACDWSLLKSEPKPNDCMLSFDVFIGTANATLQGSEGHVAWGYVKDGYKWDEHEWSKSFGDLKVIQNKTDIVETSSFYWHASSDNKVDVIIWIAVSNANQESSQKLIEFFQTKELYITVDGVTYNLGKSLNLVTDPRYKYEIDNGYKNDDAKKLGALLQQNAGNTLRFYCNWK
ncbi:Thoeris anti-defense Tad2 family protein [Xenorhabdus bovienii]|uniref:Thoeris anti-defense Tad2 family protein n=1 Tax=Xenorhabdus bovienii TaxID=40576 RepID=UPI003DA26123